MNGTREVEHGFSMRPMRDSVSIVMLAGAVRPSKLRRALGVPVPCMPIGAGRTLIGAWLSAVGDACPGCAVRVLVNSEDDARAVSRVVSSDDEALSRGPVDVMPERASWRGTAGLLHDATIDLPDADQWILAIEACSLPLAGVGEFLDAALEAETGAVAIGADGGPLGMYLLRRGAINAAPDVGFTDFKEQFLPRLHSKGMQLRGVRIDDRQWRIYDRRTYLSAIEVHRQRCDGAPPTEVGRHDARIAGHCVLEQGVGVQRGAVVHESVLLAGAVVGRDAIVSRSVVGPFRVIKPGTQVVRTCLKADAADVSRRESLMFGRELERVRRETA